MQNPSTAKGMTMTWPWRSAKRKLQFGYSAIDGWGRTREVAQNLNVGHLMLLLQFGNMRRQLTLHNTELFAKRVMPQLTNLFDDHWENAWWPTGL